MTYGEIPAFIDRCYEEGDCEDLIHLYLCKYAKAWIVELKKIYR